MPLQRWDSDAHHDPAGAMGKAYVRAAAFCQAKATRPRLIGYDTTKMVLALSVSLRRGWMLMIAHTSGTSVRRQLPWTRRRASCSRQAPVTDLQGTWAAAAWLTSHCAGDGRGFCNLKSHARCHYRVGRCHRHICRLHVHRLWCAMLLAATPSAVADLVVACPMPSQQSFVR